MFGWLLVHTVMQQFSSSNIFCSPIPADEGQKLSRVATKSIALPQSLQCSICSVRPIAQGLNRTRVLLAPSKCWSVWSHDEYACSQHGLSGPCCARNDAVLHDNCKLGVAKAIVKSLLLRTSALYFRTDALISAMKRLWTKYKACLDRFTTRCYSHACCMNSSLRNLDTRLKAAAQIEPLDQTDRTWTLQTLKDWVEHKSMKTKRPMQPT